MELKLARGVKNSTRLYRCTDLKRKVKENVPTPINEKGELASTDMEKAEVHDRFITTEMNWLSGFSCLRTSGWGSRKQNLRCPPI